MMIPAPDAMPTTRGLNFFRADPNLEFVCSTVMAPDVLVDWAPAPADALAGDHLGHP